MLTPWCTTWSTYSGHGPAFLPVEGYGFARRKARCGARSHLRANVAASGGTAE